MNRAACLPPIAILALLLLLSCAGSGARADKYALCIGIDHYDDLNPLRGAARDAQGVGSALVECAGFPAAHVQLLVSGDKARGDKAQGEAAHPDPNAPLISERPTRKAIVRALSDLRRRVKPGDVVFILFAGHGIEMDGQSYLLPDDCDGHDDLTLKESAISAALFREQIGSLNARALILAFDMCRTDPRTGKRDVTPNNTLSDRMARAVLANSDNAQNDKAQGDKAAHPLSTIALFACSPHQSSYEYQAKQRGYFSFFLEQGLRDGAADGQGVVKAGYLIKYVEKAVTGAVQRDTSHEQTPYSLTEGADTLDLVLAENRPAQSAGATAVSLVVGKSVDEQFDAAYQRGVELWKEKRYDAAQVKFEEALQIKPNSASTINELAKIEEYPHKNYAEAERLYRKAMALDPKDFKPVNNLGRLYEKVKRDYAEAERLYRKAMELDPKNAYPVSNLAKLYVNSEKKDYTEAQKLYRKAMNLDPTLAWPVNDLGQLYCYAKAEYAEAEKLFLKAIELDPKEGWYHANLALCLSKMNRQEEAMKQAKEAIALGSKDYIGPHPIFKTLGLNFTFK